MRNLALVAVTAIMLGFGGATAMAEPQPNMHRALQALEEAENLLQGASNDKGRHKRNALRSIRQAQREVREGIRYDNRH
jgi:hypothetical protein